MGVPSGMINVSEVALLSWAETEGSRNIVSRMYADILRKDTLDIERRLLLGGQTSHPQRRKMSQRNSVVDYGTVSQLSCTCMFKIAHDENVTGRYWETGPLE